MDYSAARWPNTVIAYLKANGKYFSFLAASFNMTPHRLLPCFKIYYHEYVFNSVYDSAVYSDDTLTNKIILFSVSYLLI